MIELFLRSWGLNSEGIEPRRVNECITPVRQMFGRVEPKACYINTFNIVAGLYHKEIEAKYVTGITYSDDLGFPFEHAWLSINGEWSDPTLEALNLNPEQHTYIAFAELDLDTVLECASENHDRPPCPEFIRNRRPDLMNSEMIDNRRLTLKDRVAAC